MEEEKESTALQEPGDVQNLQIEARFINDVLQAKLRECDQQNTLLLALANQQQEQINTLQNAVDELARSQQNREQRRASVKKPTNPSKKRKQ